MARFVWHCFLIPAYSWNEVRPVTTEPSPRNGDDTSQEVKQSSCFAVEDRFVGSVMGKLAVSRTSRKMSRISPAVNRSRSSRTTMIGRDRCLSFSLILSLVACPYS